MRENTNRRALTGLVLLAGTCAAAAATPENWDIEIVCRSSLDAGTPAFRLPQFSSLSSQYVSIGNGGEVAIRVVLAGSPSEGIFVGNTEGGGLEFTATSPDPVWSASGVDLNLGWLALQDGNISNNGVTVHDLIFQTSDRFDPGGVSASGGVSVGFGGSVGYRGRIGLAGYAVVLDQYVGNTRVQTAALSTLDADADFDFILNPSMNLGEQFVVNTIPISSPSRRIYRLTPDGNGGYDREVVAETGPNADGNFSSFVNSTAISNDGRVAFNARRAADSIWQVNRRDDPSSPIVKIAEGGQMGIVNSNLANFPPVVNSNGLVAFRVEDSAGSTALYVGDGGGVGTGDDSSLVRVLGFGDTVMTDLGELAVGFDFGGQTGVQVMNGVVDINDSDQIAFAAFLENGTIGVFIATPAGGPGCNPADIAEPFEVLDLADVQAFITAFQNQEDAADLAAPFGVWDLADLQSFVTAFNAGCP